jgi:hypothetical protein
LHCKLSTSFITPTNINTSIRHIQLLPPRHPQNPPQYLPHKPLIPIRLIEMPQRREKAPPPLKLLTPRQRMIVPHLRALETARIAAQQDFQIPILTRVRVEIIPLVHPVRAAATTARNEMVLGAVFGQHDAGLWVGMHVEVRAAQLAVPFVVRHAGGCAVDGDDAAAGMDEVFQRIELGGREDGADGLEQDDGGVWGERGGREKRGVFAGGYGEVLCFGGQGFDAADAGGDRVVSVARGFAEDEDLEGGGGWHCGGLRRWWSV